MSEEELYELARKRIDRRNRRLALWGINLGGLILSLALLILVGSSFTAAIFIGWIGVFVLHSIMLGLSESRNEDIESEVAKLREVVSVYEKPKRLELSEDGELVDDEERAYAERSRNS